MFTALANREDSFTEQSALCPSSESTVRQLTAEFEASLAVVRGAMKRLDAVRGFGKLEQR